MPEQMDLSTQRRTEIPSVVKEILNESPSGDTLFAPKKYPSSDLVDEKANARFRYGISDSPQDHIVSEALAGTSDRSLSEISLENIQEVFRGRVMVDIGSGSGRLEYVGGGYEIAKKLGASAYIAIEPYYGKNFSTNACKVMNERPDQITIPITITEQDALSFLKRLKSGSASIFSSATDEFILKDREYNRLLESEIDRVVGDNNGFLEYDSVLSPVKLGLVKLHWNKEEDNKLRLHTGKGSAASKEYAREMQSAIESLSAGAHSVLQVFNLDVRKRFREGYDLVKLQQTTALEQSLLEQAVRELVDKSILIDKAGQYFTSIKYINYSKFTE